MRLGILGAGAIGEKHAEAAAAAGVQIARVVDQSADRAKELATAHNAQHSDQAGSLWDDAQVDAVVIGVPNCFHKPLAAEALRAGKHVLLEKPMALSAEECDELIAIAKETGKLLQIGYTHRFTAVGQAAKRIADSGDLGEIYHAKAHLYIRRGIPGLGGWFTNKSMSGGGCLIDLGVHLIDLVSHLMSHPQPVAVSGKAYSKHGVKMRDYVYESMWAGPPKYDGVFDVEDSAHAMVTYASGATLDLQVTWAADLPTGALPDSLIGLFGDQGGLTFELFGDHVRLAHQIAGRNADSKLALPAADQMALQMADFAAATAEGRHGVGATPEQGRAVQAVVDAIYASSEKNQPITL